MSYGYVTCNLGSNPGRFDVDTYTVYNYFFRIIKGVLSSCTFKRILEIFVYYLFNYRFFQPPYSLIVTSGKTQNRFYFLSFSLSPLSLFLSGRKSFHKSPNSKFYGKWYAADRSQVEGSGGRGGMGKVIGWRGQDNRLQIRDLYTW